MKSIPRIILSVVGISSLILLIIFNVWAYGNMLSGLPLYTPNRCGIHTIFLQPNSVELDVIVSYEGEKAVAYCEGAFVRMAAFFSDYTLPFSLEHYDWKMNLIDCSSSNKTNSTKISVYSNDKNFSVSTCNKFKTSE